MNLFWRLLLAIEMMFWHNLQIKITTEAEHTLRMSVKSSTELMLYVVLTMPTLNKAYLYYLLLLYLFIIIVQFVATWLFGNRKQACCTKLLCMADKENISRPTWTVCWFRAWKTWIDNPK